MWQLHYARAQELALERMLEAERVRLARIHADGHARTRRRTLGVRRGAAVAAAWLARRLDETAANDALALRSHVRLG
jgi:hypothetical protein